MSGWTSRQPRRSRGVPTDLRLLVLARDHRRCQIAGPTCTDVATEVDHVVPWAEGGADDLDNLQAVCHACHAPKTQAEAQRARARYSRLRPAARHPLASLRSMLEDTGRTAHAVGAADAVPAAAAGPHAQAVDATGEDPPPPAAGATIPGGG